MNELPTISSRALELEAILQEKSDHTVSFEEIIERFSISTYEDLKAMKQEMKGFLQFENSVTPSSGLSRELFTKLNRDFTIDSIIQAAKDGFRVNLTDQDLIDLKTNIQELRAKIEMPHTFKVNVIE